MHILSIFLYVTIITISRLIECHDHHMQQEIFLSQCLPFGARIDLLMFCFLKVLKLLGRKLLFKRTTLNKIFAYLSIQVSFTPQIFLLRVNIIF